MNCRIGEESSLLIWNTPIDCSLYPCARVDFLKEDGGIDHQQVTEIEVIAIEDTHDVKNQRRGSR